jgi:hypothetical protein
MNLAIYNLTTVLSNQFPDIMEFYKNVSLDTYESINIIGFVNDKISKLFFYPYDPYGSNNIIKYLDTSTGLIGDFIDDQNNSYDLFISL